MNAKKCAAVAALIFSLTVVCTGPAQTQAPDDIFASVMPEQPDIRAGAACA
jgi:hypothetical protein